MCSSRDAHMRELHAAKTAERNGADGLAGGPTGPQASVMPVRARPPADSRTAAATAPDTSGWNTLGTM
ncbi:hypothetical protein GCM10009525_62130 [Streptosporangium amethystogenes subsp. fukuiense]